MSVLKPDSVVYWGVDHSDGRDHTSWSCLRKWTDKNGAERVAVGIGDTEEEARARCEFAVIEAAGFTAVTRRDP